MHQFPDQVKLLSQAIQALPEKQQAAIFWLIANYDTAILICKEKTLTEQEREQCMDIALQKDDMYFLVLLLLERIINA